MNSFLFSDESEKKHALACLEFAKRLGLIDDESLDGVKKKDATPRIKKSRSN